MIIKPIIRNNIFLNAHPIGCENNVKDLFLEAKTFETFDGPKRVLIIGGSSGYGLSSRVALTVGSNAKTINVSYESRPKDQRTGTAGYWNNLAFLKASKAYSKDHYDIIGNAFSDEIKTKTIEKIKETFGQIDLLIYSLASGARLDEQTGQVIYSAIKPIGEDLVGKTIDIGTKTIKELQIPKATETEIEGTVFVMGGSDWAAWVKRLDETNCLSNKFKTISYTYVGSGSMDKIYRSGTIGKAKDNLEITAIVMNKWLKDKYEGEALISSSKAVTTKASVFIPGIASYLSCLFEVMKKNGVHESILAHKYRLFKDMVYGNKRLLDEKNRIRIDHHEMDEQTQKETVKFLNKYQDDSIFDLDGTNLFIKECYQINGFEHPEVSYEAEVDLEQLMMTDDHLLDYLK